jgi:hypothetical protein
MPDGPPTSQLEESTGESSQIGCEPAGIVPEHNPGATGRRGR